MAKYTTQIRSIVESGYPIFDFDYPIFDKKYKGVLEQNIINHYYFREIGLETVEQFKHFLKTRLNIIMPYYNRLYETEHLITKTDYNINLDNTITRTNNVNTQTNTNSETNGTSTTSNTGSSEVDGSETSGSTSSGTSSSTNTGQTVFSDTPQARLQGEDYATNMTDVEDTGSTTTSGSTDGTVSTNQTTNEMSNTTGTNSDTTTGTGALTTIEQYTEHLLGNGSMRYNADILQEWRDTWLNIDKMIIDELQDLFMNIY